MEGTQLLQAGAEERDGRRLRGDKTRRAILTRAMQISSVEGLEGLSLGRLAADLGISKSGLFAHFGSKEELQLKTLRAARRIFYEATVRPALGEPEGISRLAALVAADPDYLSRDAFEGGCLFISSAAQYDSPPGPHRAIVQGTMTFRRRLPGEEAPIPPR